MPEHYVEGSTVNCVLAFQGKNWKQNSMKLDVLLPLKMLYPVVICLSVSSD